MKEIERKFLVKEMPNLENMQGIVYERYFIEITPTKEIRIQRKGEIYEKETKTTINTFHFEKIKDTLTQEEFAKLKAQSIGHISRTSYQILKDPNISLKIYSGKHQGFMRIEVEFKSEKEAQNFIIPDWFGREITGTKLGKDSELMLLS